MTSARSATPENDASFIRRHDDQNIIFDVAYR
jgi:hypothetical protein